MPAPSGDSPTFKGDSSNARFGNFFSDYMTRDNSGSGSSGSVGTNGPMGKFGNYPNGSLLGGILRALNRNINPTNPISGRPIVSNWTPPPSSDTPPPNGTPTPPPGGASTPPPLLGGGTNPNTPSPSSVPITNTPTDNTGSGQLFNTGMTNNSDWLMRLIGQGGHHLGVPIGTNSGF